MENSHKFPYGVKRPVDSVIDPEIKENIKPKQKKHGRKVSPFGDKSEGRYPGLNSYESDLLDYLRNNFPNSDFSPENIKLKTIHGGNNSLYSLLARLLQSKYIESQYRDGDWFYHIVQNNIS